MNNHDDANNDADTDSSGSYASDEEPLDQERWNEEFELLDDRLLGAALRRQQRLEQNPPAIPEEVDDIQGRQEYFFGADQDGLIEIENAEAVFQPEPGINENEQMLALALGVDAVREIAQNIVVRVDQNGRHIVMNLLPHLLVLLQAIQVIQAAVVQMRPRIEQPFIPDIRFDLAQVTEGTCRLRFRFQREEIYMIVVALRLPDIFILDNGSKVHCVEAICISLRRLAYPCRLFDLIDIFGRSQSMLSRIFNATLRFIFVRWRHLLIWDPVRLTPETLEEYHAAIRAQGAPCQTSFAFIDGTVRAVCRPTEQQEDVYNGHKRVHAMKYQSVAGPSGIIEHLSGPYLGRRHDSRLFRMSGLARILRAHAKGRGDRQMTLYGDPAYRLTDLMQRPFPTGGISPEQRIYNERMSKVRIGVEWCFGYVLQYFPFSDFKKNQKTLLSEVHLHYICSVLLANIRSCVKQTNSSASKFNINPPTLEEYLHN